VRRGPHPFTTRQLQYAVAVAEAGSFRRAAVACGVSQPSLSAQIGQLEEALEVRLFERDRRQIRLTAAGAALVTRARRVLTETDDLVDAARHLGDPLAGTLRIGVIPTVSPYLLPGVVRALRRAHPALVVRWLEDKTDTLVAALHAGELDAALLALEAAPTDLDREVIGRDPFVLAAPNAHPLARRTTPVTASDLHGVRVLLLDDGHCLRDQALALCAGSRAEELDFRATSLSTLTQMVSSGAGVTLLPQMALPTESRRAAITLRPLADESAFRTIGLAWRRTSPLSVALRTIATTLREAELLGSRAPGPARRRRRAAHRA
jgi:LysR family transcriptional regulator, hydrogen peroxide-inducible genes activator